MDNGLIGLIQNYEKIKLTQPVWVEGTPKTILVCLLIYLLGMMMFITTQKRYHRSGVEHGSADWADINKLQKEFHSNSNKRIVYSQNFAVAFDKKALFKHKRNLNTLITGGPGSGKTTGYVYPNLLELSASNIVLDPSGEVCRNTAKFMIKNGYKVKVLNLKEPE